MQKHTYWASVEAGKDIVVGQPYPRDNPDRLAASKSEDVGFRFGAIAFVVAVAAILTAIVTGAVGSWAVLVGPFVAIGLYLIVSFAAQKVIYRRLMDAMEDVPQYGMKFDSECTILVPDRCRSQVQQILAEAVIGQSGSNRYVDDATVERVQAIVESAIKQDHEERDAATIERERTEHEAAIANETARQAHVRSLAGEQQL